MDDSIEIVVSNYRKWLGHSPQIYQTELLKQFHSNQFAILNYTKEKYQLLCTAGASKTLIPHSLGKFGNRKGCAYEYFLHSNNDNLLDFYEILVKVSLYPYITNTFLTSGHVLDLGQNILNSQMNSVYLTDPYEDDEEIYSKFPNGQIILPEKIIQTLWIIPIYPEEATIIREHGTEFFDQLLGLSSKEFTNLHRKRITP